MYRAIRVFLLVVCSSAGGRLWAQSVAPVRVSVWYWLNSAPKTQWRVDFDNMRKMGATDVLLVWGLDAAAFSIRLQDSHQAIRQAHAAGLGSYLFVWHARHSSLPHQPEFQQVDAAGHHLFAFDVFNPQWRGGQWKTYLTTLAREYGPEPGLAGYVFDNSFAIGQIGSIDGPAPKPSEDFISYNQVEEKMFGKKPPVSPADPTWPQWTESRKRWWADWARDTKAAVRAVDPNPKHQLWLEDGENAIDPDTVSRAGVDLRTVMDSFDVMGAYWAPAWSQVDGQTKMTGDLADYLQRVRASIGQQKSIVLSLRLSEGNKEDVPGKAAFPELGQIEPLIAKAVALGVRQVDLYGYRMGVYHLDNAGWHTYRPGSGSSYPLTGQIQGKFLCDRPELRSGLETYLRKIEER